MRPALPVPLGPNSAEPPSCALIVSREVDAVHEPREVGEVLEAAHAPVRERPAADRALLEHLVVGEEAHHRLALRVLDARVELREPGQRHEPAEARARAAQAVLAEQAREHERLVLPVPRVRVDRVHPAELGEELAGLELEARVFEAERQRDRLEERLLDLELRLALRVEEVDRGASRP